MLGDISIVDYKASEARDSKTTKSDMATLSEKEIVAPA
jgi:hypothetical protein